MIYTGYYSKVKKYEEAGLTPIAISGVVPEFYKGKVWKWLAPKKQTFLEWKNGDMDNFQYTERYEKEVLSTLDMNEFRELLLATDKPVFICYEKPGDFCHRHVLADWIERHMGFSVDEYIV